MHRASLLTLFRPSGTQARKGDVFLPPLKKIPGYGRRQGRQRMEGKDRMNNALRILQDQPKSPPSTP